MYWIIRVGHGYYVNPEAPIDFVKAFEERFNGMPSIDQVHVMMIVFEEQWKERMMRHG
jgi:hypothetical protein